MVWFSEGAEHSEIDDISKKNVRKRIKKKRGENTPRAFRILVKESLSQRNLLTDDDTEFFLRGAKGVLRFQDDWKFAGFLKCAADPSGGRIDC